VNTIPITEKEFKEIRDLLYDKTGIYLPDPKKYLVVHRLMKRLMALQMDSFKQYVAFLKESGNVEIQHMIDNLTTNETFFFREEKHFKFLKEIIKSDFAANSHVRIWSAACSSGEEVYSAGMILGESFNHSNWEIIGSDISDVVLKKARKGAYVIERSSHIPKQYLIKYCLKGTNSKEGEFIINNNLRKNIRFLKINLNEQIPDIGLFEIIFLRNTLIYFDMETKRKVIQNVLPLLKNNGYLIVSHTENLVGITNELELQKERTSIYRKK
jgi:chemotaxis protein methyltransferase CheR